PRPYRDLRASYPVRVSIRGLVPRSLRDQQGTCSTGEYGYAAGGGVLLPVLGRRVRLRRRRLGPVPSWVPAPSAVWCVSERGESARAPSARFEPDAPPRVRVRLRGAPSRLPPRLDPLRSPLRPDAEALAERGSRSLAGPAVFRRPFASAGMSRSV